MKRTPIAADASRASAALTTAAAVDDAPAAAARAVETTAAEVTTGTTIPTLPQGLKIMIKTPQDFAAFGKANLEAFTASTKIWTAGVQDLSKQFAATAKASVEESVAAAKSFSSVKSIKDAIELQTFFSKTAAAKALAESKKLTEASVKLTEQALAPITARVAVAVESFSKAA
jgi:phasin family protein